MLLEGQTSHDIKRGALRIPQLIKFNSIKQSRKSHVENVRHSAESETPLQVYLGILLHVKTRKKKLINSLSEMGVCISYYRVAEYEKSLAQTLCTQFTLLNYNQISSPAIGNIDHNATSSTASNHFHGTSIPLFQHPPGTVEKKDVKPAPKCKCEPPIMLTNECDNHNGYYPLEQIQQWFNHPLEQIQQWFNHQLEQIQQWFNHPLEQIQQWFNHPLEQIQQWFNHQLEQIQQWFNHPLEQIQQWFNRPLEQIQQWFNHPLEQIQQWFNHPLEQIQQWFNHPLEQIQQWFNHPLEQIQQWFNHQLEQIQQWFNRPLEQIQQWFNHPLEQIQQWFNRIDFVFSSDSKTASSMVRFL